MDYCCWDYLYGCWDGKAEGLVAYGGWFLATFEVEIIAGSIKRVLGFSMILKSLICSILNVTSAISFSLVGTSFYPFRRPSEPRERTWTRVMDLLTGSTALKIPSYLIYAVVMIDSFDPSNYYDCNPPPWEGCWVLLAAPVDMFSLTSI
jgi:hypothetical protein